MNADSPTDGAAELRETLDSLCAEVAGVSEFRPVETHPRGGFCVWLEWPDGETETVAGFLWEHGWRWAI